MVHVVLGDDGVQADGQIGGVKPAQPVVALEQLGVIAGDAANPVVLFADPVEGEVDDDLGAGSLPGQTLDPCDHALDQNSIGGDVDDAGTAIAVGGQDEVNEVVAQEWLPAAEGQPIGSMAEVTEGSLILIQRKILDALAPDVAGLASGIAPVTDTERQIHWQRSKAAGATGQVIQRRSSQLAQHENVTCSGNCGERQGAIGTAGPNTARKLGTFGLGLMRVRLDPKSVKVCQRELSLPSLDPTLSLDDRDAGVVVYSQSHDERLRWA